MTLRGKKFWAKGDGVWILKGNFCLFLSPKNIFLFLNPNALDHTVIATGNQKGLHLCWTMQHSHPQKTGSTKWCWFLPSLTDPLCLLYTNTATSPKPLQPSDFHLHLSPECHKKKWWMCRILFPLEWSQLNISICFIKNTSSHFA